MKNKPSRPVIIQNISWIYKKNVKYDKNQINFFFCEKPVSKPVRSQQILKKNLGHQSLLFPWHP